MSKDTTYIEHPDREERPLDEEEDEEITEVTRLRELLEERLQKSKRRLNGVTRKVDELQRVARKKDSASKMRAVVSDVPAKNSPENKG